MLVPLLRVVAIVLALAMVLATKMTMTLRAANAEALDALAMVAARCQRLRADGVGGDLGPRRSLEPGGAARPPPQRAVGARSSEAGEAAELEGKGTDDFG